MGGRQLQQVTAHSETLEAIERSQSKLPHKHGMEPLTSQIALSPEQKHKKELMQCVLLELGILFHSVFIGMALSVATGNDFIVLLIAISAGLLTYASIADLIVEDFLSDESWRVLRGRKRIIASLLVFGGAFGMSLIGAWA